MNLKTRQELLTLMEAVCEESATAEQMSQLERLLSENSEARAYYIEYMVFVADLKKTLYLTANPCETPLDDTKPDHDILTIDKKSKKPEDIERIKFEAEKQLKAFLKEQHQLEDELQIKSSKVRFTTDLPTVILKFKSWCQVGKKVSIATAAILLLGLMLVALTQSLFSRRVVAVLGETSYAQWTQEVDPNALRPGILTLEQGYARILFKKGADVLLQAPCSIRLIDSNKMHLESGRVIALAEKETSLGFTIETPHSQVTDFGTEFGVLVRQNGGSETHVFQGKVQVAGGINEEMLKPGQAVDVDVTGSVNKTTFQRKRFNRNIPENTSYGFPGRLISLADIVGGGNGYGSGTINVGMNPETGKILTWNEPFLTIHDKDGGYTPVENVRYVDGVFVPYGQAGKVPISSTGLVFHQCPPTNGTFFRGIFNGVQLSPEWEIPEIHQGAINGEFYGTESRSAISMHPNAGITFDLDQIRKDNPGVMIQSIKATCAISENVPTELPPHTDFWVLIDGDNHFHCLYDHSDSSSTQINVTIPTDARFISLVTTSNNSSTANCWAFFAEPMLVLKAENKI